MNALSQTLAKMEDISDKLKQWALNVDFLQELDNIPLGVCILNEEGRIEAANKWFCQMSGYSLNDLKEKAFTNFITKEKKDYFNSLRKKFFESPFKSAGKLTVESQDGKPLDILFSISSLKIRKENKQIILILEASHLLQKEDQKEALKELESFDELLTKDIKTEYVDEALQEKESEGDEYDLKLQLNRIEMLVELLQKQNLSEKKQKNILNTLARATKKAIKVTEEKDQLDLLESGEYNLELNQVDLLQSFKEAEEQLKGLFKKKNLTLLLESDNPKSMDGTDMPYLVYADKFYLDMLVYHLLENAAEASPENQTVLVHISTANMSLEISVHNWGIVPESIRSHFFEKYMTKGKKRGTGLGTYISKMIAKAHKGMITMRTNEDTGTYVVVAFPTFHTQQSAKVA